VPADASTGACTVRVVRTQGAPATGPTDGTLTYSGTGTAASDAFTALESAIAYYYTAYSCNGLGQCETTGRSTSITLTLGEVLRGGGYTIRWRHASADVCSDRTDLGPASTTTVPDWWKSCDANCPPTGMATARQLNAAGYNESTVIGNDMRARNIPVGRVVSSEFCRAVQTAQYMAFAPPIEQRQDITYFVYDEANRCAAEQALLAQVPAAGTNTAIIGHSAISGGCTTLNNLAWGSAAVYRPNGAGGSTFVAVVAWDAWDTL
jgi:phosphohistidine phosphatase SixA